VILTSGGPVTPVGIEQRVEQLPEVAAAAAVGVGPAGVQQIALVIQPEQTSAAQGLAPAALADRVRSAAGAPVAAVLQARRLPTDVRHASKIDRSALAGWAGDVLAGKR
jgi:acyl-coenzyme A synthetase/AMP-(fatty) acid ligase